MVMNSSGFSSPSDRRFSPHRFAALTLLFGLLALAVGGCDNVLDDDDDTSQVRSLNLIEDAPTVQFRLGETGIGNIGYLGGTGWAPAPTGAQNFNLAIVPPSELPNDDDDGDGDDAENDDDADDDPLPIGQGVSQNLETDAYYTFIAYGTAASPQLLVMQGTGLQDSPPDNNMNWQVISARPAGSPAVDLYITAPEAQIPDPRFVATLNPGASTDPSDVPLFPVQGADDDDTRFTDMIIELREPGTSNVLFRSFETRVTEQTRVVYVITNNVGPGPSGYRVVKITNDTVSGTLIDQGETAGVRVVHVSATTPALDMYPNTTLTSPLAQNVAFRGVTPYVSVAAGEVGLIARPSASPADVLFLEEFNSQASGRYTAYAVGPVAEVDAVVSQDETRPQRMHSLFRFFNSAASFKDQDGVDIYLTEAGEPLEFDTDGDTVDEDPDAIYQDVAYQTTSNSGVYASFKPGEYDVHFTRAGTTTVVLGPVRMTLGDGLVQTYVLVDDENAALALIPVTDAAPAP